MLRILIPNHSIKNITCIVSPPAVQQRNARLTHRAAAAAANMKAIIGHECVAASKEHPSNSEREVMSLNQHTQPV